MTRASVAREASSRMIRVLLVPAARERLCRVAEVEYSAAALSDAIGGGLLADLYYGDITQHADGLGEPGGAGRSGRFCFYADENRVTKRLPGNPRAAVLAARLGCIDDLRAIPLTGDVLVTGATRTNDDADVPCEVLAAARRGGLLPASRLAHARIAASSREVNHQ